MKYLIILCCLLVGVASNAQTAPRPEASFASPDTEIQYDRIRDYDVLHSVVELSDFNFQEKSIRGRVTHALKMFKDLKEIRFDQSGLIFDSVVLNPGQNLAWKTLGDELWVTLPREYKRGEVLDLTIDYQISKPASGIYIMRPDEESPERPHHVWTQGESENTKYWIPCYDYPNERMTTEQRINIDSKYTVIGNGELVHKEENANGTTDWHFRMTVPHVPYLQSLAIGEYELYELEADGIPIRSYTRPSLASWAERSYRRTGEMMEIFNEKFGVKYPYPIYSQTEVEEYLYGGMENITATTLTPNTLHDAIAGEAYGSEALVAHELGHQWWGDLVTTKGWSHIWINEGFATYSETLFWEFGDNVERGQWDNYNNMKNYIAEDKDYRRPVATKYFESFDDMFDAHSYNKGSCVVHMLRHRLGDEVFFETLQTFLEKHHGDVVETADLRNVAEEVSGLPLDRFFDQWVLSGGHPEFEVSWDWDSKNKSVKLTVEQTQKVDELTPLFEVPVEIELSGPEYSRTVTVWINQAKQEFNFEVMSRPILVEFDRENWIVKTIEFEKETEERIYQMKFSPAVVSRARAAEALGKHGGRGAVQALKETMVSTTEFWGVRQAAADALGSLGSKDAKDALLGGLETVTSARVRVNIAESLANFEDDEEVLEALGSIVASEFSYHVVDAALTSLASLKSDRSWELMAPALDRDAVWRDSYRRFGLDALSTLKKTDAYSAALPFCEPGVYWETRAQALKAVGAIGHEFEADSEERKTARRILEKSLDSEIVQVRRQAVRSLGTLKDEAALPALERVLKNPEHPSIVVAAKASLEKIRESLSEEEEDAVDSLADEIKELKKLNEALEKKIKVLQKQN